MNRPIHASATEQRRVGGVNDDVSGFLGDVGGAVEFERLAVGESQSGYEVEHGDRCQVSGVRSQVLAVVALIVNRRSQGRALGSNQGSSQRCQTSDPLRPET